jgi:asparagine synthase (glutamine-hydrolysing)
MCGICGTVGRLDEPAVHRMVAALAHRGPDGTGVRSFPAVEGKPGATLGHLRLSIIDLSERGAQPMQYGGRYWITYNGELYNFRQLRQELEAKGHRFNSDSDTEVVLAMFAEHGPAMLGRLNGIFAFAIWDDERHELFVARDKLGVKPLYYAQSNGDFVFGSEIKALLQAMPTPSLRPEAISDYLTFLWVPDPDTMFDGISKLPPGHFGVYRNGRLELTQYWDLEFDVDEGRSESSWAGAVETEVRDAVERQMVSDAPLGSFLSGGIDSSAIVAEMKAATANVTAYTIGFSERDRSFEGIADDLRHARDIARLFDLDYHEQILEPRVVDLLPKLVYHLDDLVADPAAISTYLICSAASERLKVILSGMGGDEIFAGYPRYLAARLAGMADVVPQGARRRIRQGFEGRFTLGRPGRLRGPRRNMMKLVRGLDSSPQGRYLIYSSYYRAAELERLLSPELRSSTDGHDPFRHHRAYFEHVAGEHWLNQILYVDAKTFLPCLNLAYTDKMSMAASTEVRVPLLDDELVQLAARIPPNLKLRRLTRKYIFKKSMENLLPREVVWRKKAGFSAPLRSWLVGELSPMVDELLSPANVRSRGLFEPAEVQRIIKANRAGTEDNALRLWALLKLELWQQAFVDGTVRNDGPAGLTGLTQPSRVPEPAG